MNRKKFYLMHILNPFDDWENKGDTKRNLEAKEALRKVYCELLKMKTDKQYKIYRHHTSYLYQLVPLNKALMGNKYLTACNELMTLLHDEPFMQARIYNNVIKTLRNHLEDGEAIEKSSRVLETPPSQEFSHAISYAKEVVEQEQSIKDKIIILDFIIEALEEDIKSDSEIRREPKDFRIEILYELSKMKFSHQTT